MGFEKLPPEIVAEIAGHLLSREDLHSFAQVNSQSYSILRRAVINSQNLVGLTLSAQVSKTGNQEAVASWLQEGPDVNLPDLLGRTPLSWASENGHKDIVQSLLQSGAKVNMSDGFGRTALSWAAEGGHHAVAKLLVDDGARVQVYGLPNIHRLDAARRSHPNLSTQSNRILFRELMPRERNRWVRHQLQRYEPLCHTDPLSLAKEKGHKETINFLQQFQPVPPITGVDWADLGMSF